MLKKKVQGRPRLFPVRKMCLLLSVETADRLAEIAHRDQVSQSAVVRRLLREAV